MEEYKKIIPCLDTKDGKVVKGIKFVNVKDVADPVVLAKKYVQDGADEIVILDISATLEGRKNRKKLVETVAKVIKDVPLIVGGGVSSIEDFQELFDVGASKVSINSAAVKNPQILKDAVNKFGSDKIVLAVDVIKVGESKYNVVVAGGTINTGLDAVDWVKRAKDMGIKEILLTSMDTDGVKAGYDLAITKMVKDIGGIKVTASGGCGKISDFLDALTIANADGALAASMFHYAEVTIPQIKKYLAENGVSVKI